MDKTKVTAEEMARGLSMFCKKFSKHLYENFGVKAQGILGVKLDEAQLVTLAREIWIINLWIISKVLSPDKKVLGELHKIYLFSQEKTANMEYGKANFPKEAEKELHERYEKYYDAWDNNSGGNQSVLAMTMLEYMLNKGQPDKRFTNFLLISEINSHMLGMMKAVLDFRKDFEITNQ
ncbi:MAG: hypothetical protein AAB441_01400 [Patescibacteria group bacterium]